MILRCIRCTYERYLFQALPSRMGGMGILTVNYSDDKAPKRSDKSFLQGIKEKNMMIDELPKRESINSLLKVQRHSQTIPKGFKTIYQFPAIKYFGLINRLKIYQTAFTAMASLGSIVCYAIGIAPGDIILTCTTLGFAGCLFFYSLGYVTAHFIGFIYYDEREQMVRIAYVDFWGRRRDVDVPVTDIMPRAEAPVGLINKVWYPLRRYSTSEVLKLQIEQGIIFDKKAFEKIL